jgi:hypothetical protein
MLHGKIYLLKNPRSMELNCGIRIYLFRMIYKQAYGRKIRELI